MELLLPPIWSDIIKKTLQTYYITVSKQKGAFVISEGSEMSERVELELKSENAITRGKVIVAPIDDPIKKL